MIMIVLAKLIITISGFAGRGSAAASLGTTKAGALVFVYDDNNNNIIIIYNNDNDDNNQL